jgi:hypothetical protein
VGTTRPEGREGGMVARTPATREHFPTESIKIKTTYNTVRKELGDYIPKLQPSAAFPTPVSSFHRPNQPAGRGQGSWLKQSLYISLQGGEGGESEFRGMNRECLAQWAILHHLQPQVHLVPSFVLPLKFIKCSKYWQTS